MPPLSKDDSAISAAVSALCKRLREPLWVHVIRPDRLVLAVREGTEAAEGGRRDGDRKS